ncbi:flavodoxin-like protein [Rhizobium sp. PP-F2F-G36]|nr:flavodoxin-like protein [Rhizobium sp. PP-F2F-G36]
MTADERSGYYAISEEVAASPEAERLINADSLVLIFPTWWFGFPAILKGWFDRVWINGTAYDRNVNTGAMEPRLTNLRTILVITALGAPWWVDYLVMRKPVKRILKMALMRSCTAHSSFTMFSLYEAEQVSQERFSTFCERIGLAIAKWPASRNSYRPSENSRQENFVRK